MEKKDPIGVIKSLKDCCIVFCHFPDNETDFSLYIFWIGAHDKNGPSPQLVGREQYESRLCKRPRTIVPACGAIVLMIVIFAAVSVVTRRFSGKDKRRKCQKRERETL